MKPPRCGVGQSDGLLVIAHGRPHVYIRAATQKPRHRKGPGGASAHAVYPGCYTTCAELRTCLGHPVSRPVTMQEFLTRALRGPYGADKFAHFDTKNSVLMTWPPGLLGPEGTARRRHFHDAVRERGFCR